ncbi:MAG: heparan N-sulfatase, partial [Verrucomicrobia bacterium]|nr:heparan N-sulfatase [Verrucomicrobiota bacterium]
SQYRKGQGAPYGRKTVGQYIHRSPFELYDIDSDPDESENLASKPEFQQTLKEYQGKLKNFQKAMEDPWIMKWDYE